MALASIQNFLQWPAFGPSGDGPWKKGVTAEIMLEERCELFNHQLDWFAPCRGRQIVNDEVDVVQLVSSVDS